MMQGGPLSSPQPAAATPPQGASTGAETALLASTGEVGKTDSEGGGRARNAGEESTTTDAPMQQKPAITRARKTTPRPRARKTPTSESGRKPAAQRRKASPGGRQTAANTQEQSDVKQGGAVGASDAVMNENQPNAAELPPSQDPSFRRSFLQTVYRQLQATHPNQDDAVIRQIATNVEMDVCRKSKTRAEYVAALDREIQKLMRFEMAQANATTDGNGSHSSEDTQINPQRSVAVSSEMQGGQNSTLMTPTQSRRFEYAQALAKAQAQSDSGEKSPGAMSAMAGDGSFMQSLMTNQDPTFAYDQGNSSQQQQQPQQNASNQDMNGATGEQLGPVPPVTSATSQGFSPSPFQHDFSAMQGQGVPRNAMEAQQQQQVQFNMQQQQQPGQQRSQQRASTLLEFSAQVQHFDKTMLVELLWNQRNALAQWQRRANQLEYQIVALRNATNGMGSPGLRPPYYNVSPAGVNPYVASNATVEAEMQRARERNSMRVALQLPQQQQPYPHQQQPQYGGNNATSSPVGTNGVNSVASAMNPGVYWEKIRVLKAAHAGELCLAHRALAHHNAPPNSVHSVKAQSVKNNIALVLNILNEPVRNLQPRSFDVLASIERFIQTTVIPIVRKVQSSGMVSQAQSTAMTSGYESNAMSGRGTATTNVTHASNVQSSHENSIGGGSDANGGTENQLPGGRWSSPNSFVVGGSALPLASRTPPAEIKQVFRNIAENDDSDSGMGPRKAMMGQQTATDGYQLNRPESSYMPSRLGNDGAMAAIQMGSRQTNGSMDQNSAYGATTALKAPSISAMPPSEPRPPAFAEPLPSSKANSSSSDATNKLVQPPSGIDDSLNDFSDFPELDFDDALQESLTKGGSQFVKENNPVNVAKKRGIEDV